MKKFIVSVFACAGCLYAFLLADVTYPDWWVGDGGSTIVSSQPPASANTTAFNAWMNANYAPATLGQLKYVAAQAKAYLDDQLADIGGAGTEINDLVAGFSTDPEVNRNVITLGQLKYVAKPFYDRLSQIGFNTTAFLAAHSGNGSWSFAVPWNPSTSVAQNYAVANLGQLKFVFTFDLADEAGEFSLDVGNFTSNSYEIPDYWLVQYGLDPADPLVGDEDPVGMGWTVGEAYAGNFSPIDLANAPAMEEDDVRAPTGLVVSPLSYVTGNTGNITYNGNGLYLSWVYNGMANFTVTRQRLDAYGVALDAPAVVASNVSANTYNDQSVTSGYKYRYWVQAVVDGNTSGYSLPAPRGGWLRALPPSDTEGLDPADPRVDPAADPDNDGLSNYEEYLYATDPGNPDSDGDGVADGEDALALDAEFTFPRVPLPHFAMIDLGAGVALGADIDGDVLIQLGDEGNYTYKLWSQGNFTTVPTSSGNNTIQWSTIAPGGVVMGRFTLGSETDGVARWDPVNGLTVATHEDLQAYLPGTPLYGYYYPGIQATYLADDGTVYINIDYHYYYESAYLDEHEAPLEFQNYEWQLFKLDGSGLHDTGEVALLDGAYDDDPMLESGIQYEHHLQSTAQGDELSIGLYVPYNAPGNLPTSGGGSIRTYHYSGFYQLRAMVREAGTGDDIVVSPLDYNLGNIYHAFGNLTHPVIVTQGYDNTMLVFHDGNYTRQDLTADPRTGERVELKQITDRGNGLSSNATNPFWYNGRGFPAADIIPSIAGDPFNIFAFAGGIFVGNLSGNVVLAGNLCIDPLAVKKMDITDFRNATIAGNYDWIQNPAVIVNTGNHNATLMAYADETFLKSLGANLSINENSHIYWAVNTFDYDPGNTTWPILGNATGLNGTVYFPDGHYAKIAGHEGKIWQVTVPVYGVDPGRVRFDLEWYHNGTATPMVSGGNASGVPLSHIKYEALVGPLLDLKYRIQRTRYYQEGLFGGWTPVGSSNLDYLVKAVQVANIYLRQAGIQLVPDTNTSTMNLVDGLGGNSGNLSLAGNISGNVNYIGNSTLCIFDVDVGNGTLTGSAASETVGGTNITYTTNTDRYYRLHGLDTSNPKGSLRSNWTQTFLANNHDGNVVQIALFGEAATETLEGQTFGGPGFAGYTYFWAQPSTDLFGSSLFDYIVSTNDTIALDANHSLSLELFREASYGNVAGINTDNLYGFGLYLNPFGFPTNANLLGLAMAHETGHVLTLRHRYGFVTGDIDQVWMQGGKIISGPKGTNLMDYFWDSRRNESSDVDRKNVPQDIDLHQAIIMRNHAILQTSPDPP